MFHVNEIYLSRVKSATEGKTKDPGAMQDGALLNIIKNIQKPRICNIVPRDESDIPITTMARLNTKSKVQ